MIPPVPFALRLPLAFAFIALAIVVRLVGDLAADGLRAVGEWAVPELRRPRR